MRVGFCAGSLVFGCGLVLLTAGVARAQDAAAKATAVQLFDEGDRLMNAGKVGEACPKYAASMKLDPQLGALLHLADCYAKNGQLASAWGSFRDAEEIARSRGDERAALANERTRALEPRLSSITLVVSPDVNVAGLEILVDGNPTVPATWGMATFMDPGAHRIDARAPGRPPWSTTVSVAGEAQALKVNVMAAKVEEKAAAQEPVPAQIPASRPSEKSTPSEPTLKGDAAAPKPSSRLRTPVLISGGVTLLLGVGAAVTGGVYLGQRAAFDKVNDAQHTNSFKANARERAETMGLVSDVLLVGTAAGAVITGVLFFSGKPSHQEGQAAVLTPWLTADGAGLAMEGSL